MPRNLMEELMQKVHYLGVVLGLWVAAQGCGNSVEPSADAELDVSWVAGPDGCRAAGVETVRARLDFDSGTRTKRFDCERGSGMISGLRPANYRLRLRGLDDRGEAVYGAGSEKLTIRDGEVTEAPRMRLTALPASVHLVWRFGNGRVCGANGVDQVRAALFDADDYRVAERTVDCTEGRARFEEVPPGESLAELRAEGPERSYAGAVQLEAPRGQTVTAEIVLEGTGNERAHD